MKAAIDIGTNTVLLLVAKVEQGRIAPVHEEQRIPRLGKGVDESRIISPAAAGRVIDALKEYKQLLDERFPEVEKVVITATSAVRDASNREEFLNMIFAETGFHVQLLSGKEEAEWTTTGAVSTLKYNPDSAAILDIGGGSAEVAFIQQGNLVDSYSYDMGSVRYTEKYLHSDPPTFQEIENCRDSIKNEFENRSIPIKSGTTAIGVAGTLTTLAAILQSSQEYHYEMVNEYIISSGRITEFTESYCSKSSEIWLMEYPDLLKGRADIFLAGLLILNEFLAYYEFDEITVSAGGIRHGALLLG